MSNCNNITIGLDLSCLTPLRKYAQRIVFINKSSVQSYSIDTSAGKYRITFKLKAGDTGFAYDYNENSSNILGTYEKEDNEGFPEFKHGVQLLIEGVSEKTKFALEELDFCTYFAALMYADNTVEIYGFENGFKTDYVIDLPSNSGASIVQLTSPDRANENTKPLVYFSNGKEKADFDKNFLNN